LVSTNIVCRVCTVQATALDTDQALGKFRGRISWGPNMRYGVVDETIVTGYKVTVVDACGLPLTVPDGPSFRYLPKQLSIPTCCSPEAYSLVWSLTLPQRYSHFMVVPYSDAWGEQDAGLLIRIVDYANGAPVGLAPIQTVGSTGVAAPRRRWPCPALAAGAVLLLLVTWPPGSGREGF